MACLYKRRRKYWVSYVLDGELIQKSLRTENERLAKAKVKQIESELTLGSHEVTSKLPLGPALEPFCTHLEATRTRKSYKNNVSRLRVFFGPMCEALRPSAPGAEKPGRSPRPVPDRYAGKHVQAALLEDITPQLISRFLAARLERDGWSAKTANLMRQTLHKLFAYAIKHHGFRSRDRRYSNPAAGVDRRREPAPQIRFLTLEQIDEELRAVEEHPTIHAMVATYIYAGLRREEAIWLVHDDVDLNRRLIRVRAKTVDGECWQPKTKRDRAMPISRALLGILRRYEPPVRSGWFFPSPTGKRWDPDNFSHDLRKINRKTGLNWRCLDFRHTFGSQLAQKGESLYKISSLMGNSPEIWRRHYAALIPEEMTDVVEFEAEGARNCHDEDGTREIVREILHELKRQKQAGVGGPSLQLRIPDDPA